MDELKKMVTFAVKKGASDIHLVAGSVPHVRINGILYPVKKPIFTQKNAEVLAKAILKPRQLDMLDGNGDVDVGMTIGDHGLRINVHSQSHGFGFSIRIIPPMAPTPKEIGLTEVIVNAMHEPHGLVIVTGAAGTGKSTTIASLIQEVGLKDRKHIITLEDPIEYRFPKQKGLIEQRQLGSDFNTFASGLKHVLRQDPDLIMVGEMRDPETIELALTAAETGHLVITTLHAPNAAEAIERIVNVFDGFRQQQILVQLSASLRMVVAQTLLPSTKGGRVAAREIMIPVSGIRNAIRQNKLSTIQSSIETGRKYGMVSMKQAMEQLEKDGLI